MSKRLLSFLFCGILSALGILMIVYGILDANRPNVEDYLFTSHMLLTVPGILAIGSGLLCLTRKIHRSGKGFVLLNFVYTVLGGFLIECVYFQFIHFGTSNAQPRMAIPAIGISVAYGVLFLIFHVIFAVIYGKLKK